MTSWGKGCSSSLCIWVFWESCLFKATLRPPCELYCFLPRKLIRVNTALDIFCCNMCFMSCFLFPVWKAVLFELKGELCTKHFKQCLCTETHASRNTIPWWKDQPFVFFLKRSSLALDNFQAVTLWRVTWRDMAVATDTSHTHCCLHWNDMVRRQQ